MPAKPKLRFELFDVALSACIQPEFNQLTGVNEVHLKMEEPDLVERLVSLDKTVKSVFFFAFLKKIFMIMYR
ncbi:hypothetical protein VCR4J2_250712 [Vibrio coralliirubri]|nr:hypothetical protein VCR4J2_250712 [Vibrio coralliirubri]